jgi:hypothetical protein
MIHEVRDCGRTLRVFVSLSDVKDTLLDGRIVRVGRFKVADFAPPCHNGDDAIALVVLTKAAGAEFVGADTCAGVKVPLLSLSCELAPDYSV